MKSRVALVLALAPLSAGSRPTQKFNNNKKRSVAKWYSILLINMSDFTFQLVVYKYSTTKDLNINFI
jgi:hypothetical protein